MPHKIVMIVVAVAVLTGGVFVGLGNDDAGAEQAPDTIRITEADQGTSVILAEGGELVVTLEGNPTTGYTWEPRDLDEAVLGLSGEPAYEPSSSALGAPGTMTFTFTAAAAGETDLLLVYHRPWEDADPLSTFTLHVTVE